MLICGIDLSTPDGSVAFLDAESGAARRAAVRSGYARDGRRRDASALLLPALDRLLRAMKRRVRDIGVVALTGGPGSFTGLRVALASAEGLAFENPNLRLAGVGTLHAATLARMQKQGRGFLSPVYPAGRGEIYAALYEAEDGRMMERIPVRLCRAEEWAAALASFPRVEIFGPAATMLAEHARPGWNLSTGKMNLALAAARWAEGVIRRGGKLPPPRLAYVRPPDAKELPAAIGQRLPISAGSGAEEAPRG